MLCDFTSTNFRLENKKKILKTKKYIRNKNNRIHKKFGKQYNTKKMFWNLKILPYNLVDNASGILSAKN